jgi:DNA-binding FadR family transcriptional regulator
MELFDRAKSMRISENIEDQIRGSVFSGKLEAGNRLPPENELAKVFGTSRATVREALRALEREGLLEIRQGVKGGSFVRKADASPLIRFMGHMLKFKKLSLEHLTEARLIIEPEIAKLAAQRATHNDISRLKAALDNLRIVLEQEKRDTATNINFHRILGETCKNPALHFLNQAFLALLQEKLSSLHIDLSKNRIILKQHTNIYKAIKAKDAEKAYMELKEHILTVKKVMRPFSKSKTSS